MRPSGMPCEVADAELPEDPARHARLNAGAGRVIEAVSVAGSAAGFPTHRRSPWVAVLRCGVGGPSSGTGTGRDSTARAIGRRAATRDDLTGSRAIAGLRIPDLDFDVVTLVDNKTVLSVVTGIAAEGDLVVGPGRDVTSDPVHAMAVGPAGGPSRGEIIDFEVRRIGR